MHVCMLACMVLNGNVFGRYVSGIMIMNKDLCACLKGHLWEGEEGEEGLGKDYRPYRQWEIGYEATGCQTIGNT